MKPALILACTIAAAAVAGLAVSLVDRPGAHPQSPNQGPPQGLAPTPIPHQPDVELGFSVADDAATGQVVLFGGVDNYSSTWLWNGHAWTFTRPAMSPAGRFGASSAYDPQSREILLFGGRLEPGQLADDTWAWTGRTWKEVNRGGAGPPGGEGSDMAWDSALGQMMLVTPAAGSPDGAETWVWGATRWVREPGGDLGSADSTIVIAFDPLSQSMLAEGCCAQTGNAAISRKPTTWRWDGSGWVAITTSLNPLDGSLLALDPASGHLILCACDLSGGLFPELWAWSGADWQSLEIQPIPVEPEAEVTDVGRHQFLLLGSASAVSVAQPVQTWTLRGPAWRRLDPQQASG